MKKTIDYDFDIISLLDVGSDVLSHSIYASKDQRVDFYSNGKSYVYFLKNGEVEVHRQIDDIVIVNIRGPAIIGLTSLFSEVSYHYFKCVGNVNLMAVDKMSMIKFIDNNNLWKDAFLIASNAARLSYQHDEIISSKNVYGIVKNHLELLWSMDERERLDTSIFDFVMRRNVISRSSLNKILKDLSSGGYIEIKRGKLFGINKLPIKY